MAGSSEDIWQGGNSKLLNFESDLKTGFHIMTVAGAEPCCDG